MIKEIFNKEKFYNEIDMNYINDKDIKQFRVYNNSYFIIEYNDNSFSVPLYNDEFVSNNLLEVESKLFEFIIDNS